MNGPLRVAMTLLAASLVATVLIMGVPAVLAPVLAPLGQTTVEAGITVLLFGGFVAAGLLGGIFQKIVLFRLATAPIPLGLVGLVGLAIGFGGLALTTGLATLAGLVCVGAPSGAVGGALLLGLLVVAVQVAGEEAFVRGWLLPSLARDLGMIGAVIATALLFAALQLPGGARSPVSIVNLILGGILFGLLAWRSGGLLAPIAAHFAWNASEMLLLGLDPNPGMSVYGALWNLDLVGSARWGGSREGLNASIAMTVVLVALILPVAAWRTRSAPVPAKVEPAPMAAAPTPDPHRHAWLLGEES